jgi:hypothetical protein
MYPSPFELEQRRRDIQKAAEQHTLVQIATEGTPNLWQRVTSHLPQVQITAPTVRVVAKQTVEAVA